MLNDQPSIHQITNNARKRLRRTALLGTLVLVTVVFGGWLYHVTSQHALNIKLIGAVRDNDPEAAILLLAQGADPNLRDIPEQQFGPLQQLQRASQQHNQPPVDSKTLQQHTLLEMALTPTKTGVPPGGIVLEKFPLVEALLNAGARAEDSSIKRRTPLMTAVRNGHLKTVEALLAHGANPIARNDVGQLPLHFISNSPDALEIAELLVKRGNAVDATDNLGRTPLMSAAFFGSGNLPVVRFLIAHGANVNVRSNIRTSVLLISIASSNMEVIRFLLEHGAEANAYDGYTLPLNGAVFSASPDIVEMLLAHGAKVDHVNRNGNTPLIFSIQCNSGPEIVKVLIAHGADLDHRNKAGETALSLAIKKHAIQTIQLLVSAGAKR